MLRWFDLKALCHSLEQHVLVYLLVKTLKIKATLKIILFYNVTVHGHPSPYQ